MQAPARSRYLHFFTAYGGGVALQLRRDNDANLAGQPGSSLPSQATAVLASIGGVSRGEASQIQFRDLLSVARAVTEARGDFQPARSATRFSHGNWSENQLPAVTTLASTVEGVTITNGGRKVEFASLSFTLSGASRVDANDRPAITLQAAIDGFAIDGHPLRVRLVSRDFLATPNLDALRARLADPKFARFATQLIAPDSLRTYPEPPRRLPRSDYFYATVVDSIKWVNPNQAPSDITFPDRHRIRIPGFGTIILGELRIGSAEKKISLVRLELGSPYGGEIELGFGGENGSGWPP
jgi:hypothetical protein